MGELRKAYKISVAKAEGKIPFHLGHLGIAQNNIKMYIQELGCTGP
jgi:hypothetical protein